MAKRRQTLRVRIPPYQTPPNNWRRAIHAEIVRAASDCNVTYQPEDKLELVVTLYIGDDALAWHDIDNRLSGSHHIYVHPRIPELMNIQDVKGKPRCCIKMRPNQMVAPIKRGFQNILGYFLKATFGLIREMTLILRPSLSGQGFDESRRRI